MFNPWLAAAVSAAMVLATGCSGPGERAGGLSVSAAPSGTSSGLPQDEGGPLTGLPPCDQVPPAAAVPGDSEVPGLLVPPGTVLTDVRRQGPLTTVKAYVGLQPVLVRRFYQEAPGLEIFEIEDEIFEAEVLFADGKAHRNYVKATARCREGSTLLVVVAPEVGGPVLPSPSGG